MTRVDRLPVGGEWILVKLVQRAEGGVDVSNTGSGDDWTGLDWTGAVEWVRCPFGKARGCTK